MSNALTAAECYINAMNTGNLNELEAFIDPDFHQAFYGFPNVTALEEAKAYIIMLRAAYPDLAQTIDTPVGDDERVAFRGTLRGTHKGDLRGIVPTGNRIDLPDLALAHVHNGKLTGIWIAADKVGYLQQLGVRPTDG